MESSNVIQLVRPPGLTESPIPALWAEDPWVHEKFYYTLPVPLLEQVIREVGRDRFGSDELERETGLSRAAGNPHLYVGLWKDGWIQYPWMAPLRPIHLSETDAAILGKRPAQAREVGRLLTERVNSLEEPVRGYCGWLLTNTQFLDEHDRLFERFAGEVSRQGLPAPLLGPTAHLEQSWPTAWVEEWRRFCSRWRLQSLAGPYLPVPWAPRIPDSLVPAAHGAPDGTATAFVPDIFPLMGEGSLQESLEDALRGGSSPEHLRGWMRIVSRTSTAKHTISTFARRFRLQHYWRLLQLRHAGALQRKKQALMSAFSTFLQVSTDTVKGDLDRIAKELGKAWEHRAVSLMSPDQSE